MNLPDDLKYTKDHEWIKLEGDQQAIVGVTEYAIEQLGDIVHVDLPEKGESFGFGDSFGTIESTKTVSDLYLPVKGNIVEVNQSVVDAPESLQEDAYDQGWLVKVAVDDIPDSELLTATEYENYVAEAD